MSNTSTLNKKQHKRQFEQNYREVQTRLTKYFRSKRVYDNEDIVAHALSRAWERLPLDHTYENLAGMSFTVAKAKNIDNIRYHERRPTLHLADVEVLRVPSTPHTYSFEEYDVTFEEYIKDLSEKDKTIFRLFYRDGHTTKEIAKRMNTTDTAIRVSKTRALSTLKSQYKTSKK